MEMAVALNLSAVGPFYYLNPNLDFEVQLYK
jgi:hypothetical protein